MVALSNEANTGPEPVRLIAAIVTFSVGAWTRNVIVAICTWRYHTRAWIVLIRLSRDARLKLNLGDTIKDRTFVIFIICLGLNAWKRRKIVHQTFGEQGARHLRETIKLP